MTRPTELVEVPSLGIDFEIFSDDASIGPAIASGMWEAHETALFRAHLSQGARVVDLGANVGWYSALAVLAGAEVHAFEPVPEICAVARRNVERAMARGTGRGVVHQCAAGAAPGKAHIVLSSDNYGDNRVLDEGAAAPDDMSGAVDLEIEVARVDDHVQGPVQVLKIDTQGSEWLALEGAQRLLDASPSLALLIEFWPYALRGATPKELLERLTRAGFRLGKATAAPYVMEPERILRQALARDPVKGGIDLYGTRGRPFHVLGLGRRLHGAWRAMRES